MKERMRVLLFWFILLQPFLDLYWFYHGQLANALPFTLPTIVRLLAIFCLLVLFFSSKENWQKLGQSKWLIAYLVLLAVYGVLHLWHCAHFISVSPNDYQYSTGSEIFYLIRLFLPLITLYLTKEVKFNEVEIKRLVLTLSGLFSGTIVIANLFVVSLRAYGNGRIWYNILMWFSGRNLGYSHIASKGFFNFSNMVSAVLFMLLPLMLYYLFREYSWQKTVLCSLQALAMLELGTKVAAIGLIGGLIVSAGLYFFHYHFLQNTDKNKKALLTASLILVASLAILPFGPAVQRYQYEKYLAQESDHDLSVEKAELKAGLKKYPRGAKREAFLRTFIKENYHAYALNKRFVFKSYPYQYDPEFWIDIMHENGEERMQNRHLEQAMLNRVVAKNNNHLDPVLGISYTRQTHIFNLERDFISQVYSLGWPGMILFIGPYVVILLYGFYQWFKKRACRTYLISSLLTAILFMLLAAYASGNVMDFLTATFILSFAEGSLLTLLKKARA